MRKLEIKSEVFVNLAFLNNQKNATVNSKVRTFLKSDMLAGRLCNPVNQGKYLKGIFFSTDIFRNSRSFERRPST